MPTFAKIERGVVPKAEFDKHVPAHLDYVKRLNDEGRNARSGYWGEKGGGMLVFDAESLEQAERIVAQDPLVENGCVEFELHEWVVVAGP